MTDADPDAIRLLFESRAELALVTQIGRERSTEHIRTPEQLEAALESVKPKEEVAV